MLIYYIFMHSMNDIYVRYVCMYGKYVCMYICVCIKVCIDIQKCLYGCMGCYFFLMDQVTSSLAFPLLRNSLRWAWKLGSTGSTWARSCEGRSGDGRFQASQHKAACT